ncbi:MAG: type I-F CRISPR-associated endoribonuclease Cas6/Csy4 [Pseudomonas sp.]|jgi:CRISPR-associated endonuclease Csy4|nr:type I-F CRISPR-associated endoribonuclease Cas6/Csy4 [Xanthomonadaceae bacterium]MDE2037037.1 type I-F CRISPR-associated endoribonuclease Cas6/Csy4 [Pseudomonas sp.]MDE2248274.1 type I-F CRISPR-associated endoribonuclease Cas6/Csy4 [Xanthomonadaceae bacterium]MDE3211263.1 type I-F CRISPR-associated endoribonuclease Cas6/Csy4 [Pseudomonadota bacterium]
MDHYLDIRLLSDPEFAPPQLMSALFAKLHRALAQLDSSDIGISFPAAGKGSAWLGNQLRLHGSLPALQRLMEQPWLSGMRDHAQCGELSAVPDSAGHMVVRRIQAKSNPERLRRRQMKRKGWSAEEARAAIPDSVAETLKLPFLNARSVSTGQSFRLFIDQHPIDQPATGTFNAYGLSTSASLPRF